MPKLSLLVRRQEIPIQSITIDSLIRSSRRTVAIEITEEGKVIVRAPNRFPIDKIDDLVNQKKDWIKRKLEASLKRLQNRPAKQTLEEIRKLRENAAAQIQDKIDHFSKLTQTPYRNLKISNAKRRWGTCTSSGQIHINWRLVLAPEAVLEYVIIHELMHIREMSHSRTFWARVEAVQADYRRHRQWLKANQHLLSVSPDQ